MVELIKFIYTQVWFKGYFIESQEKALPCFEIISKKLPSFQNVSEEAIDILANSGGALFREMSEPNFNLF